MDYVPQKAIVKLLDVLNIETGVKIMREIKREYQVKNAHGKFYTTFIETDENKVNEELMHDLIAKKLESCSYIRSIKRIQNYDGTLNIIVNYRDGRNIYTVKTH